jgi:type IV secretory pathway VirD2 relaxase
VRGRDNNAVLEMRYVRTIEELEGGVVLVPRGEVGPYSIRKDSLQSLESTRRGTYALPAAVQRTSGQNKTSNVVEMRVTNKETTGQEGKPGRMHTKNRSEFGTNWMRE